MKQVKKFETFEALKADEKEPANYSASLKKHNAFEEFVKSAKNSTVINKQAK